MCCAVWRRSISCFSAGSIIRLPTCISLMMSATRVSVSSFSIDMSWPPNYFLRRLHFFQHDFCGTATARSPDSAAGVGAGASQVNAVDVGFVIAHFRNWPVRHHLIHTHIEMADIALQHPEHAFDFQ